VNIRLLIILLIVSFTFIGCVRKEPEEPNARTSIKCYSGALNTYDGVAFGGIIRFDDRYVFDDSTGQRREISGSCLLTKLPPDGV